MIPVYDEPGVTLYHGDCIEVMRSLPDASVHAVVTDPPYGLEFMGRKWDGAEGFTESLARIGRGVEVAAERAGELTAKGKGHATSAGPYLAAGVDSIRVAGVPFQEWCEVWATEALRVLKPGGYMLAFGGSRTWHRLSVAIEDAGFEIRDSIAWLYGSGFPKSMDVSKAIDKAAGAEREVIGRDPNWRARVHGEGTYEGGQTRPEFLTAPATQTARDWQGWGTALKPAFEPIVVARKPLAGTVAANVMAHGTGAINIDATRVQTSDDTARPNGPAGEGWGNGAVGIGGGAPEGRFPTNVLLEQSQADELDSQTGVLTSGLFKGKRTADKLRNAYGDFKGSDEQVETYGDSGGASRFFPTFHYEAKAPGIERPDVDGVEHPTVKPLDLMRWLVRLVASPGAVILEPFAGSGTTLEACLLEGFDVIGIEREDTYLPLIMQRIRKPLQQSLFGELA